MLIVKAPIEDRAQMIKLLIFKKTSLHFKSMKSEFVYQKLKDRRSRVWVRKSPAVGETASALDEQGGKELETA